MRNVFELQPGVTYTVRKKICDYYDNTFEVGEKLSFTERNYLPYDGGHTLVFGDRRMYLQQDMHAEILNVLGDFLTADTG